MSATTKSLLLASAAALVLSLSLASAPAFAKSGSSGGGDGDRVRLECEKESLNADDSMDARFEARRGRVKFDASYEAAPGGTTGPLDVVVDGILVDSMDLVQIGGAGDLVGDRSYDSRADEGEPFPADFPDVGPGTIVQVGDLGCRLS